MWARLWFLKYTFVVSDAVLNIWRPSEEVMNLLSEGSRLRIYHLTAAGVRLQIFLFVCLFARISPALHRSHLITCEVYRTRSIVYSRRVNFYFSRNRLGASELQASTNQNMKNKRLPGSYYLPFCLICYFTRLDCQPLVGKGARVPSWNLFGE